MSKPITKERKLFILNHYLESKNRRETSRQLGISTRTIDQILKEKGIKAFKSKMHLGDVEEKRELVLDFLSKNGTITSSELTSSIGHSRQWSIDFLNRMQQIGLITRVSRGIYSLPAEKVYFNPAKDLIFF